MAKNMAGIITKEKMLSVPAVEISSSEELVADPMVSVAMMTWNHEEYIAQAIESVIAQECGFEIELLIGEDFSTDATRVVCERYQKKYPDVIRLIVAHENVGIQPNFLRLIGRCRGKYIALLEGDDYWTDTRKLHKQVAMMESHPEYSWCGAKTANRTFWVEEKPYYDLEDTLRRYIMHTSSAVFRAELLETYPDFPNVQCLESMVYAYLSQHGMCGFLNETVSYYRIHSGGIWTGADISKRMRLTWSFTDIMDDYFDHRYSKVLYDRELWICKMDTDMRLQGDVWKHWLQSLSVVRLSFPRLIRHCPLKYLAFALNVSVLPIKTMYYRFRAKLSIRKRLNALFDNLKQ